MAFRMTKAELEVWQKKMGAVREPKPTTLDDFVKNGKRTRESTISKAQPKPSSLPSWLIEIAQSDLEIALACSKKRNVLKDIKSPFKQRLVDGLRHPEKLLKPSLAEHWLQVRLLYHIEKSYPDKMNCIYAVPNGGYRSMRTATMMKFEGQARGIPDLCLPIPMGAYHGMYLEVKTEVGRLSVDQNNRIKALNENGYFAAVGYGFDQCLMLVENYMDLTAFDGKTILS